MKLLTFLFILASMSLGFAGGLTFMAIFSKNTIKTLRAENRQLRSDIRLARRQKRDTIEIIYNDSKDEIDFSQRW